MIGTKVDVTFKRPALGRLRLPRVSLGRAAPIYRIAEIALMLVTAALFAWLVWVIVMPTPEPQVRGPAGVAAPSSDPALLTRYDPFFPAAAAGAPSTGAPTDIKLFGISANAFTGRGSAIIATPDGQQASYATGDAVLPGLTLKSVAPDHIIIARGGSESALYLYQTTKPVEAAPVAQQRPGKPVIAVFPGLTADGVKSSVKLTPQLQGGRAAGFTVAPGGSKFAETGLQPGDVIIEINGAGFENVQQVNEALAALPPGTALTLIVMRAGNRMTLGTRALQ